MYNKGEIKMIMQKSALILLWGMSLTSYGVDEALRCADKKKADTVKLISFDQFTEEQKRIFYPLVRSGLFVPYRIDSLEEKAKDPVKEASDGHYKTVRTRGPFIFVRAAKL